MATTGIVSGTKLRLFIDDVAVARATNCKFSTKNDLRQTVHKDNVGDFATYEYGDFNGDLSSDFLVEETANGLKDLLTKFKAKQSVTFIYGTGVTGDLKLSGNAKIEEIDVDGPVKENSKGSIKLKIDGNYTIGVYA